MKGISRLFPLMIAVICLCSCGKTAERADEASSIEISDLEEVSFAVETCSPDAVTYTVCSAKDRSLFYEKTQFAYVETYIDGNWYPLVQRPTVSDLAFQGTSIPTAEKTETISITALYGGKLENGTYRLAAPCYVSEEDLRYMLHPVYIAAEFELDG